MNAEAEDRNDWGFPAPIEVTAHERANQNTQIDQSVNKALPWVAFSWFLSGGAIIGLFLMALMLPRFIESRVAQGVAEAKAASAQELANAKADMHLASTNSLLAKERMDRAVAQLEAKGLLKQETH